MVFIFKFNMNINGIHKHSIELQIINLSGVKTLPETGIETGIIYVMLGIIYVIYALI